MIRILGIKSFPAAVNEPGIAIFGKACMEQLKRYRGKKLQILFDRTKIDKHKRYLGYLFDGKQDIGLNLVSTGQAMVYTEFLFVKMKNYLYAESIARKKKLGIWASPKATSRADALKAMWEERRNK